MKRFATFIVIALTLAACGGRTDNGTEDDNSDNGLSSADQSQPSSDGTRLLVPGFSGIDVVDLDAENQEPFIDDLGQVGHIRLIGDTLWFIEGVDLVAADAKSGDLEGKVAVPEGIVELAVGKNTAWAVTGIAGITNEIVVIDTDNMTRLGTIVAPESATYTQITVLGDDVWAFGGDFESSTSVAKLDVDTLAQTITVDTGIIADSMIAGEGAIWVGGTIPAFVTDTSTPKSGVSKLDPETGEVVITIDLGEPDDHIVVNTGFGYLWVTEGREAILHKIDPTTGATLDSVDTRDGAAGIPLEIIFTEDLVWVFNTTADTITAYNPDSLEFETGIDLPAFSAAPVFAP